MRPYLAAMDQMKEIDYVVKYAEELLNNSTLFAQQKQFLEAQYQASRSLFKNLNKKEIRKYLKGRGLL